MVYGVWLMVLKYTNRNNHKPVTINHPLPYGNFHARHLNSTARRFNPDFLTYSNYNMEPLTILRADPLDLLFENRNKAYGAYKLRKYYPRRLLISMGLMMGLSGITVFFFMLPAMNTIYHPKPETPDIIPISLTEQPPKPPQAIKPYTPAPRPPASVNDAVPVIVRDVRDLKPIPTVAELQSAAIGIIDQPGGPETGETPGGGNGNSSADPAAETVPDESFITDHPEVMPAFPGGMEGLRRFLMKNLRSPEGGSDEQTAVRVVARFVVGADGKVTAAEIVGPGAPEFNKEVLRVISKMPDWTPGSQNHRHVAVYYSLPVVFQTE